MVYRQNYPTKCPCRGCSSFAYKSYNWYTIRALEDQIWILNPTKPIFLGFKFESRTQAPLRLLNLNPRNVKVKLFHISLKLIHEIWILNPWPIWKFESWIPDPPLPGPYDCTIFQQNLTKSTYGVCNSYHTLRAIPCHKTNTCGMWIVSYKLSHTSGCTEDWHCRFVHASRENRP